MMYTNWVLARARSKLSKDWAVTLSSWEDWDWVEQLATIAAAELGSYFVRCQMKNDVNI